MPRHAFTIDVEDWYHVENLRAVVSPDGWASMPARLEGNIDRLLALLAEHGTRGTFFVLGAAAERHPEVVRRISGAGHEVASHGWSHDLVYRQDQATFREETRRSKALLEDLAGTKVAGYRASTFSITERSLWALDILAEEGFEYDSSIAPLRHDRYGIPSAPEHVHVRPLAGGGRILEFPVSYMRVCGVRFPLGGGFFRVLPLSLVRRGLRRYAERGQAGSVYLHPWEIDPGQPRVVGLGWIARTRHYLGLGRTEGKLRRLLATTPFTTMRDALAVALRGTS